MTKKYPLILKPIVKDYLWGGSRLKEEFNIETDLSQVAEAWLLALHKDGTNTVLNGECKGRSLLDVLRDFGEECDPFPILIKLIDAKEKLSVQVHPDDDFALKHEGEPGKTEMWYVVDCKEDARLVYGFNRDINREEFLTRTRQNTLDEVLNYLPVHPGDVFFIKSRTVHAIGEGILIAEIQQNSNTTYRVSDYGRLGADNKPRQLHIQKAAEVLNFNKAQFNSTEKTTKHPGFLKRVLCSCGYFKTAEILLDGEITVDYGGFVSLIVLQGEITVSYENDSFAAKKGQSIFIPSSTKTKIFGNAKIIASVK